MPVRRTLKKFEEWFLHLLHLDDSAHRIALGVAIGTFVAATPTWGIQMLLVVGIAWLLRANKVAGIPMVWVTNPFTNGPIYGFCYWVGWMIADGPTPSDFWERFKELLEGNVGWKDTLTQVASLAYDVAIPLWVGTCLVGLVAGAIFYVIMYYVITICRRRFPHHRPKPGTVSKESGGPADAVK